MTPLVLDTDVASAVLKDRVPVALAPQLASRPLAITFVTVGELTKWTLVRRWGPQRTAGLRRFFTSVVVLPYSSKVATLWGEIQAHAHSADDPDRSTTPGSPPAASPANSRSPHSTTKTSPTSPSTRASNSSADPAGRGMGRGMNRGQFGGPPDTSGDGQALVDRSKALLGLLVGLSLDSLGLPLGGRQRDRHRLVQHDALARAGIGPGRDTSLPAVAATTNTAPRAGLWCGHGGHGRSVRGQDRGQRSTSDRRK